MPNPDQEPMFKKYLHARVIAQYSLMKYTVKTRVKRA